MLTLPAPSPAVPPRRFPRAATAPRPQRCAGVALPAQEAWVGSARHYASAVIARWCLSDDDRDTAVLVVGELAANAARHGCSEMTLHLTLDQGLLRITVDDHGGPCSRRSPHPDDDPDEHGRGMHIVSLLAITVETLRRDSGRRVEASLAVERTRCSAPSYS
ncbi:ATP-binding protein [Streptomyces sp. NPDC048483]|uniref:ATP-binding protein n=1 Tax=Streptomyces sp. NPDC048483 TaxID=3154927 RepID=UPI0034173D65